MKATILNTRRAFTQVNEDDDGSIEYTVYLKLSKKYFLAKSIEHANVPAECIDGACK